MADLNQVQLPNGNTYNFVDTEGRKEENLVWGGPSQSGDVSPVGMALSEEHSANRMAFFPGSAITCEYSSDSGATWADYGYSNDSKKMFCTTSFSIPIGRIDGSSNYTTAHRTRITFTLENGTSNYMYSNIKKMLLEVSISGRATVTVEGRTGTNYINNVDTWVDFGTYNLAGWSGWNDIPLVQRLGGGSTQTGQYWQFRIIIAITEVATQYPTAAAVSAIRLFGSSYWATPSTLAKTGHLYTFDNNQNATFPGQVNSAGLSTTGVAEFKNGKMPLSAGKISGLATGTSRVYGDGIAISNPATSNDVGFIRVTGTGENDTVLEIATGDDAGSSSAESIVARQYNTSNTVVHEAKILDTNGDTTFPGVTTTNGLEVKGVIAGDAGATGHGLQGGGGYHNAYNNIILHGDNSTATSGIAFISDRVNPTTGAVTNVNQPSDRAFIQYHAYGITTPTVEGSNPTLASSGESGRFVIGIGNDGTDQMWLQTPSRTGLIHQIGGSSYVIPDTGNTSGDVGSATQPIYSSGGMLASCTYSLNATVPSGAVFTDTTYTISRDGINLKLTPSSGSAQNISIFPPISQRDFVDGTLITTDIDYSKTEGASFLLVIYADGYSGGRYLTIANGYIYNNTLINYGMTNYDSQISSIIAQNVNGKLCFWFARQAYWQSFGCLCYNSMSGDYVTNHVVSITNSVDPNGTKRVDLGASGHIKNLSYTAAALTSGQIIVADGTDGKLKSSGYTIAKSVPSDAVFTDTKNTAGSTDTSSKIFLIGATSQAANPQTYSQDTAYVGTDGCLYSGGSKVLTAHQDISGKVNRSGDTMTGALNFANGTANKMGDDAQVGDHNRSGSFGVQGLNGATTITLLKQGVTWGNSEGGSIQYNATTKSLDFIFT